MILPSHQLSDQYHVFSAAVCLSLSLSLLCLFVSLSLALSLSLSLSPPPPPPSPTPQLIPHHPLSDHYHLLVPPDLYTTRCGCRCTCGITLGAEVDVGQLWTGALVVGNILLGLQTIQSGHAPLPQHQVQLLPGKKFETRRLSGWVRCAFFDRNLTLMMPLVPTPFRLKGACV
jgi:hypothetical protein